MLGEKIDYKSHGNQWEISLKTNEWGWRAAHWLNTFTKPDSLRMMPGIRAVEGENWLLRVALDCHTHHSKCTSQATAKRNKQTNKYMWLKKLKINWRRELRYDLAIQSLGVCLRKWNQQTKETPGFPCSLQLYSQKPWYWIYQGVY